MEVEIKKIYNASKKSSTLRYILSSTSSEVREKTLANSVTAGSSLATMAIIYSIQTYLCFFDTKNNSENISLRFFRYIEILYKILEPS